MNSLKVQFLILNILLQIFFYDSNVIFDTHDREEYTRVDIKMKWWDAMEYCKDNNYGKLAFFRTKEHWSWMFSKLGSNTRWWTGYNDFFSKEGDWIWHDGSRIGSLPIKKSNFKNGKDKDCLLMKKSKNGSSSLKDLDCTTKLSFICSTPVFPTEYYKGLRYTIILEKKNWWDAVKYCQDSRLGTLAVFPDRNYWNMVFSKLEMKSILWTGFYDIEEEGDWVWIDKSSFQFKNWAKNEPAHLDGDEDCMVIEKTVAVEGGVAKKCNEEYRFLCTSLDNDILSPSDSPRVPHRNAPLSLMILVLWGYLHLLI